MFKELTLMNHTLIFKNGIQMKKLRLMILVMEFQRMRMDPKESLLTTLKSTYHLALKNSKNKKYFGFDQMNT